MAVLDKIKWVLHRKFGRRIGPRNLDRTSYPSPYLSYRDHYPEYFEQGRQMLYENPAHPPFPYCDTAFDVARNQGWLFERNRVLQQLGGTDA